jgi:chromosome partitioning protein
MPRTKIITIANQKGGVGKTTTVVTLAYGLSRLEKEVLIIDLDPQGQVASFLDIDPDDKAYDLLVERQFDMQDLIVYSGRPGLWVLTGSELTSAAEDMLAARTAPISYLSDRLKENLGSGPDFIIIDTAPSVGILQGQAIWASDLVLIPSKTDYPAIEGTLKIWKTLQGINEKYGWHGKLLGVLPTFYKGQQIESREAIVTLQGYFPDGLLRPIRNTTKFEQCAALGKTIFEYAPGDEAAEDYEALVKHTRRVV